MKILERSKGDKMKTNIQRGALLLILSLMLSSIYLNCSGNKMDPISNGDTGALSSNNNGEICANGAINPSKCTVNFFNMCVNGNTNPPDCTVGATSDTCTNNATDYPKCMLASDGTCIAGATNPPLCTVYASCANGAMDYPGCTPPTAGVFDVIVTQSGVLSNLKLQIQMAFNESDINKKGAIFLVGQKPRPENPLELQTFVCTNPCSDSSWVEWNNSPDVDWSMSGIKNQVGAGGLQTIYNKTGDLTALGGSTIYAGYGIGETAYNAVNEMLAYRSASLPGGRFLQLLTIPVQKMGFTLSGPSGGSPGALATYDLWAHISPSSADYGQAGYFFVMAKNPTGTIVKMYHLNTTSNKYEWVDWDGNVNNLGDKFYKKDTAIKNEFFSVFKDDATPFIGWSVIVGYGLGDNATDAGNDCINKKKFNNPGFVIN